MVPVTEQAHWEWDGVGVQGEGASTPWMSSGAEEGSGWVRMGSCQNGEAHRDSETQTLGPEIRSCLDTLSWFWCPCQF